MMDFKTKQTPYDTIADSYDDVDWWANPYYGPICERELTVFNQCVDKNMNRYSALDIGCGTGFHTQWLVEKGYKTTGIDISLPMINIARAKFCKRANRPEFIVCDAQCMTVFESNSFDVITCLGSTLNHINDWHSFHKEVSRLLRKGGSFIFSYENFFSVDLIFWLFRRKPDGYERNEFLKCVRENIMRLFRGDLLHNHWTMELDTKSVTIPLTYETTRQFQTALSKVDIEIEKISGIHFLNCFRSGVLQASAQMGGNTVKRYNPKWNSIYNRMERWLTKLFPKLCAGIVGVAVKK